MSKKPTVLLIMDGYGLSPVNAGNAIAMARTPVLDHLFATCPHTELAASGEDVGLPAGQIGNSEVGHTNIGAGRIVFQDLPRISNAIADESFFQNTAYSNAMSAVKDSGALHLVGLLSNGGVHSHISHLYALLEMAKQQQVSRVYIHAFLDGRDVPPQSGKDFVSGCLQQCSALGIGSLATITGRFYAMDRDQRWERVSQAYAAMVSGEGILTEDPVAAVAESYENGITDEFVKPIICDQNGMIQSGDAVIFFNYRPDRARELTWALTDPDFGGFARPAHLSPLHFVCTTQYDERLTLPIAFPPEAIENTFGEYMSALGLSQLRIAETEKYAHVTFFFNGGKEESFPGEDRILVPSPKEFPTYDHIPEMGAPVVTEKVVAAIASGKYDTIILNFANCDMVGHTGILEAAITAVETVDTCVGHVVEAVRKMDGTLLITADHGNADCMWDNDQKPYTAHTTNPVPLIICGANVPITLRPGRLCDIVPTMLDLMSLHQPIQMTGQSLLVKSDVN